VGLPLPHFWEWFHPPSHSPISAAEFSPALGMPWSWEVWSLFSRSSLPGWSSDIIPGDSTIVWRSIPSKHHPPTTVIRFFRLIRIPAHKIFTVPYWQEKNRQQIIYIFSMIGKAILPSSQSASLTIPADLGVWWWGLSPLALWLFFSGRHHKSFPQKLFPPPIDRQESKPQILDT